MESLLWAHGGPAPGRVLKEEAFAKEFPLLTAQVFWTGATKITFSGESVLTLGLMQERILLAKDWLEHAGVNTLSSYRFLVYVLIVLISLRLKAIKCRDVGVSNLAVRDPSAAYPRLCFFDLGSWSREPGATNPGLSESVAKNTNSLEDLKRGPGVGALALPGHSPGPGTPARMATPPRPEVGNASGPCSEGGLTVTPP